MWQDFRSMKAQKGGPSMLLQFRVKNFRSFAEEAVLDMTASPYLRELPQFPLIVRDTKVLPVAVVYGANSSGKSNLIEAFNSMVSAVDRLFSRDKNDPFPMYPFVFGPSNKTGPSEFEIYLGIEGYEYRYGFSATYAKVEEEWLTYKRFGKRHQKDDDKLIYHRSGLRIDLGDDFQNCTELKSLIDDTTLFLSILGRKEVAHANNVYRWFEYSACFSADFLDSRDDTLLKIAADEIEDADEKKGMLEFIQKFDPCIEDIRVIDEINPGRPSNKKIVTKHMGSDVIVPLDMESDGTNKLIRILFYLFFVLECGYILIVDELDSRFHPLLLREITSLFHDRERNIGRGQLIFTTHNPILLDAECLRRDEIWFVEKDGDGKSSLYSLADFKDEDRKRVRSDLRYMKNYLLGKFGAIPYQRRK